VEGTRLDRRPQGFILGCILHSYGDIGNARPGSESAEVGVRPTRFGRCVGAPSRERGWYHRRTKRGESRGILLPRRTLELLTAWHECTPKPLPSDWVFFGRKMGDPVHRHTLWAYFNMGLRRAGSETGEWKLTLHSFRHTYNTVFRGVLPGSVLREPTDYWGSQTRGAGKGAIDPPSILQPIDDVESR